MGKPLQIFCCYANKDRRYLLTLKKHLMPLQRKGQITIQADIDISPGENWEEKINHHLNTAPILILLISADFLASEYCYSKEMMRAIERHERREACVIPVILRPTHWNITPLGKLKALPTNAEPVTSKIWHTQDEAFFDVTTGIEKVINAFITHISSLEICNDQYQKVCDLEKQLLKVDINLQYMKDNYLLENMQSTREQFRELRLQVRSVLHALANIAQKQGIFYQEATDDFQDKKTSMQPLEEILQRRAIQLNRPFRLAVTGEFNAGKSTFINALLDREILSVSWKPTTATKTVLSYGDPECFRVRYRGELEHASEIHESINLREDLAKFTSDPTAGDDKARLKGEVKSLATQIKEVEVWCKADFLNKHEIEIIDTPGLGAVFSVHEDIVYNLVPDVDAIMFLFSTDPGIGLDDVIFMHYARKYVKHIFFIMSKCDYLKSLTERKECALFNQKTIQIRVGIPEEEMGPVYTISSREKIEGLGLTEFPKVIGDLEKILVDHLIDLIGFTLTQTRYTRNFLNERIQHLNHPYNDMEEPLESPME
jgi:hypothetical protein